MRVVAVDTETWGNIKIASVYDPKIRMSHISWFFPTGVGGVLDVKIPEHEEQIQAFGRDYLACDETIKLLWNAPFDIPVLEKYGLTIRGPVIDVKIIAQIVKPLEVQHGLKYFARKFLDENYQEEKKLRQILKKNNWEYGDVPLSMMYSYALLDARCTLELYYFLRGGLTKYDMWPVFQKEMRLLRAVIDMQATGVRVDTKEAQSQSDVADIRLKELLTEIRAYTHSSFNPNAAAQVREVIYDEGHTPERFTKKGLPSVDRLALLQRGSDIALAIGNYRRTSKVRDTYLKNIISRADHGSILHASFNQAQARTGRFSSSGPNLQNIPRAGPSVLGGMRRIFVARLGRRIVCIDYQQLELRLTAHFANERSMLEAINSGEDLHSLACKEIFGIDEGHPDWKIRRYLAKTMNFAVNYGSGPDTYCEAVLKDTDGKVVISPQVAREFINVWKEKHPGIRAWANELVTEAAKTGGIRNYYGRFLPLGYGESYKVVNYFIQSTAADLMKERMLECWRLLRGYDTHLVLTVHDELIFDMPKYEVHLISKLRTIMEELDEFKVPLTCSVEVGKSWGDKEEFTEKRNESFTTCQKT